MPPPPPSPTMDSSSDNNFEAPEVGDQDPLLLKPKEETGGGEEEEEDDGEKTLERAEELLDRGSKPVENRLLPQRRPRDQGAPIAEANMLNSNEALDGATWDDNQNLNPNREQPLLIQEPTTFMRPNKKRSSNFTDKEDKVLVLAWLNTSLAAAVGNKQTHYSYWRRIYQYFHENKNFKSLRNQNSLANRWGTIAEQVYRFCGCYDQIQTEADKLIQAFSLYRSQDKWGRPFRLLHCWIVLYRHPKWIDRLSQKKQKTASNASPGASTPGTTSSRYVNEVEASTKKDDPLRRPIGKKTIKEQLQRGNSSASSQDSSVLSAMNDLWSNKKEASAMKEANKVEHNEQAFALEEKRISLEEQKLELKRKKRDLRIWNLAVEKQTLEFQGTERNERIMSMDTSAMTRLKQQYFMSLQNEILARRCNNSD